jgi:WD40 repeat protein
VPAGPDLQTTRTGSDSALNDANGFDPSSALLQTTRISAQLPRDRYQLIAEHGRGGLGRVSRARDLHLSRDVAIKELISHAHMSEVRFLREALITARLEHPGIVPIHEAGRWPDGTPFYAMKLVAGRPLRDLIAERTTVEQRLGLLHHVIAVADAIAYAHGRNIIHRDLKPANIIVGDFGETVVIDWGLAKDLSEVGQTEAKEGPFRVSRDGEVTAIGSVLGTPAYMAPEQERGEQVDQRADVFAIGAMLWEVCSLQKVPPADIRLRHRLLRRASIDPDLSAIIDKSLARDPQARYSDAGALAADLRAFKSGARVAARSYSMMDLLAHWTRRHRAVAAAMAITALLTTLGVGSYVRSVAAERDRADRSEDVATSSLNELTLKHAELLLTSDPSEALDVIAEYRGPRVDRAQQIRAESLARGVATLRATPHADKILWARGLADRGVVSLGVDGTIVRTEPDGRSVRIASGVRSGGAFAYAESRHLLAYVCDPDDLCILNLGTKKLLRAESHRGESLLALSFSPDERQLALLTLAGRLRVMDVESSGQPVERFYADAGTGGGVLFVDRDAIAIGDSDGLVMVRRDGTMRRLRDPDGSLWDVGPNEREVAVATITGQAYLVDADSLRVTAREQLCRDAVSGLRSISRRHVVAFACKEGTIGVWDPRKRAISIKAHVDGHANILEVDTTGDYMVAASNKGLATLIDLQTGLATTFIGQRARITALAPPTSDYPFFLSGDRHGGLRAWPLPTRIVQGLADFPQWVNSAIYDSRTKKVIASTGSADLWTYASGEIAAVRPHTLDTPIIVTSPDRSHFAMYGDSNVVELWSTSPLLRARATRSRQAKITHVEFEPEGSSLILSGKDGSLARWSFTDTLVQLYQFDQPIENFSSAGDSHSIVIATQDGALWLFDHNAIVKPLRGPGSHIVQILTLPDRISVCVGYDDGRTVIINTRTSEQTLLPRVSGAIRDLAASDRVLVLIANDDKMHVVRAEHGWNSAAWSTLSAPVRSAAVTADGLLISICTDGAVWAYSIQNQAWLCILTGSSELVQLAFDDTETTAFLVNVDGHLMTVDLDAVRRLVGTKPLKG